MSKKKQTRLTKAKKQSKRDSKSSASKGELSVKAGEYAKLVNAPIINECYKPDCSRQLFANVDGHWQTDFHVAHIRDHKEPTAAQFTKGIGHRYYPAPANEEELRQREQYGNLILLCKPCHTTVDKTAPKDYSIELLHDWKRQAETDKLRAKLVDLFGDKTLTEKDWVDALLDGSATKSIHLASERELEALDPRISVTSEYSGGRTTFRLDAKEPVKTDWIMGGDAAHYAEKLDGMIKRAQPFSIKSEDLTINGSELMARLTDVDGGVMVLSPVPIPAVIKLALTESNETSKFQFDDIVGSLKIGSEIMVFDGICFGGLFKLRVETSRVNAHGNFNFEFDLAKWNGQDIRRLNYFRKVHMANFALGSGAVISGILELKGEDLFNFNIPTDELSTVGSSAYQCVMYTEACREIANHFDRLIEFDSEIEFSKEDHIETRRLADFIEMTRNDPDEKYTMSTSQVVTDEFFEKGSYQNMILQGNPLTVFVGLPSMDLKLFRQTVNIPRRANFLSAMVPEINCKSNPEVGETIAISWTSSDQTHPLFYFEDEDHPIPDHMFQQ